MLELVEFQKTEKWAQARDFAAARDAAGAGGSAAPGAAARPAPIDMDAQRDAYLAMQRKLGALTQSRG